MKYITKVFVDTSTWVESVLDNEKYHQAVKDCFQKEIEKGSIFFTCDYVIDEAFTRLITNQSFSLVAKFKKILENLESKGEIKILWTDKSLFDKAWIVFKNYQEHKFSFTDAVIATIVKDLKIDEILTLDGGFKKIGLVVKPLID